MTQKTSSSTDATPTGSHFYHHHHQNSKPHFIITPETPLTALLIISNTILPLYNQMGLVSLPKTAQKPTLQKHPLLQETRGKYSIEKKNPICRNPTFSPSHHQQLKIYAVSEKPNKTQCRKIKSTHTKLLTGMRR